MTENLVDEDRKRRVMLVSGSCGTGGLLGSMRPSASTSLFACATCCFFLFFFDLVLPRERNRLRKPMLEDGRLAGVSGTEEEDLDRVWVWAQGKWGRL